MSNLIKAGGQTVLSCSNVSFNMLYNSLLLVIEQTEHKENPKIMQFIHDLDQEAVGLGCVSVDIADYHFNQEEIATLINLIASVVEYISNELEVEHYALKHLKMLVERLTQFQQNSIHKS